jgi:flagellar export protein FliJ
MKKFDFQLEKVKRYKENVDKTNQQMFVRALDLLREQEKNLDSMLQEVEEVCRKETQKEKVILFEKIAAANYLTYMNSKIREQQAVVEDCRKDVEEKRRIMEKSHLEKKTYDKLWNLAYQNYQKQAAKQEQRQLDEVAIRRFFRSHE